MLFELTSLMRRTPGAPVTSSLIDSPSASTKVPMRMTGAPHASNAETTNVLPVGGPVDTHETVGGTVSMTVTFCVAVDVLPDTSCAVHVTTVVPTKYFASPLLVNVTVPAQSSVAVGVPRAVPLQSFNRMSGGTDVKAGGVVSTMVTVCVACTTGSAPSSPLQVTVLGPMANWAGASLFTVTAWPLQTSVAAAKPKWWSRHELSVRLG